MSTMTAVLLFYTEKHVFSSHILPCICSISGREIIFLALKQITPINIYFNFTARHLLIFSIRCILCTIWHLTIVAILWYCGPMLPQNETHNK